MSLLPGRFRRRQLLGARLAWLIDLTIGGRVLRLSTEYVNVRSTELGVDLAYEGRVEEVRLTQAIELFADTPEAARCSVETTLPLDLADHLARGYRLEGASIEVSQWIHGSTYEQRVRRLVGRVSGGSRYGDAGEPVSVTAEARPIEDHGTILPADAAVNADTWPTAPESSIGRVYPLVFGAPGANAQALTSGSPALPVEVTSSLVDTVLVNAEPTVATTVTIISTGDNSNVTLPITSMRDGRGRMVAVVDISGQTNDFRAETASYYARWDNGGATYNDTHTGALTSLGDVLLWALRRTTLQVDVGRIRAVAPLLVQRKVDGYVDQVVGAWEWIRAQLLPMAPVSAVTGADGLYLALWRRDLQDGRDTLAHLDLDADPTLSRTGELGDEQEDPVNRVTVNYALRVRTGVYQATVVVEETPAARDSQRHLTPPGRATVYADRVIDLPLVHEQATASLVAMDALALGSLPTRSLSLLAPSPTWEWVEPGMPLSVSCSSQALVRRLYVVEAVERADDGTVGLELRGEADSSRDVPGGA